MIIAHRGASADAPQNTLASFQEAIRQKADAIELDVQLTYDKKLIIMHNPTLNKTTTGSGRVTTKTLQEIKQLDAGIKFSKRFKDEKVPTLEEVFNAFGKQTNYVVELKFYQFFPGNFAQQVYNAVLDHSLINNTLFLSFDPRLLIQIKKINPSVKICWAFIPVFGWRPPKWATNHFDALAIATHKAKKDYIERLQALNKPINIWTGLGKSEDYVAEINTQAEFITTNHPAELRREIKKLEAKVPKTQDLKK
jgi:glycerophosphoryl diester phosphodiesterase